MSETTPAGGNRRALRNEVVVGLAGTQLKVRTLANAVMAGVHHSRRLGVSADFAEHKAYAPGDDLRHLDWRAAARFDRFFIRRYEEETQVDVRLLLDASESMAYRGGAQGALHTSKFDNAAVLGGALLWLARRQGDRVSLRVAGGDLSAATQAHLRSPQLEQILNALDEVTPQGKFDLAAALDAIPRARRRGLLLIVTDFIDTDTSHLMRLAERRAQGEDVLVIHVLDEDEMTFPFDGAMLFEDMEGDRLAQVDAEAIRTSYLSQFQSWLADIEATLAQRDVRYARYCSDDDLLPFLNELLAHQLDKRKK